MELDKNIDILEDTIVKWDTEILEILLKDRSTKSNILWATDNYAQYDYLDGNLNGITKYQKGDFILSSLITKEKTTLIQPRISKFNDIQFNRTRNMGEVFTPAWLCNKQNNLIDDAYFNKENVFNQSTHNGWITNYEKIDFSSLKGSWEDYVLLNRLEITCGEAPYLVNRYDTTTGDIITLKDRVGLLDRKLRVINENIKNKNEWQKWVKLAYQSIYGYEFQGDNLLLAR